MTEIRNSEQLDCRLPIESCGVLRTACCGTQNAEGRTPNERIENRQSKIKNRSGFAIVELLLAVAIGGMLLAAVAFAFNASAINCRENEEIFKTMNNARQALFRITSQLRTADAVDPNAPSNACGFITADGQDITYEYRSADKKLYLITNVDGNTYVLCDNVAAATFTKTLTGDGLDCKSVQISITVVNGDMQRKVSSAAAIRKNLD